MHALEVSLVYIQREEEVVEIGELASVPDDVRGACPKGWGGGAELGKRRVPRVRCDLCSRKSVEVARCCACVFYGEEVAAER